MSRNRRESHGLGQIFSQQETLPTPFKPQARTPGQQRSANKAARRVSLHDPIWEAQTTKLAQTPRDRPIRTARTPMAKNTEGSFVGVAANVYRFLETAGFEAQTGGTVPKNPALTPMNTDIVKMFGFLFEILEPGSAETPVVAMLEELGYTSMDQSFKRTFANSHVLANTASIWPRIIKALSYVVEIILASQTTEIPPCANEHEHLKMLQQEYIFAKFAGYSTQTTEETLDKFLTSVNGQISDTESDIGRLEAEISAAQKANEKYVAAKSEQQKVKEDEKNLEEYVASVNAQISGHEQQFEKLSLELITAQEVLVGLEAQKIRYANQFEQAGVSMAKLEEYRHHQESLQDDLVRIKDRITDLEIESKTKWEQVTATKLVAKVALEKVCEVLGHTVPDQGEWPQVVMELFSTLDVQRRDLVIKTATIQEKIINDKAASAAFNSLFDSMQARQSRLEVAAKSIEEKNEFQVRELEIKTTIINQRVDAMRKHCQRLLNESEHEHSSTRAQRLELEKEGARLDSEAITCIQTITSQTRSKIRRLDSVQNALLPGIRHLGSSARSYSKVASDIAKQASKFKSPTASKHRGTKKERVSLLLEQLNRTITDAVVELRHT